MNFLVFLVDGPILITFISSFLIWFMFGGLAILWVIDGKVKKEAALHALFSVVLAWTVSEIIKSLFPVLRPFETGNSLPLTVTIPQTPSFPSSHSAVAIALGQSVYLHDKDLGRKFLFLAILVMLGRVVSNVHSIIDVLAGGLVGLGTAHLLTGLHFFGLLKKKRR